MSLCSLFGKIICHNGFYYPKTYGFGHSILSANSVITYLPTECGFLWILLIGMLLSLQWDKVVHARDVLSRHEYVQHL